jgi:putative membrane-bound dehydrogenase-like protein
MHAGRVPVDVDISGAKKLWLVVTDAGDGYSCDWADWIEPKLIRADGSAILVTSLTWKSATAGWGKPSVNQNCSGGALKMDKRSFTNGIGTHASSIIEYDLPENFSRFMAKVGPDMAGVEQNCGTSIEFLVFTEQPPADVLSVGGEPQSGVGFEAAQASLKNMTVADGLEISLFASEPMLRNPTDIDIDERGRVWVCEGVNYRSTFKPWGFLQPAGDRIVILEDTNHDGIADKETAFYQGKDINTALGICVLGNKVIVSSSPNIFIFTDENGDGRADKKEILFSGIGGADNDHGVHAVIFGPNGKLYFNFGNLGGQIKDKNGNAIVDIFGREVTSNGKPSRQGMTFRCNPDGSKIEVLGWNFRNPYEVCVDSFGAVWQSDNDDDGNRSVRLNYVMDYGNFGYTDEMTGASWNHPRTDLEEEIPRRHWHQNDPGVIPNVIVTGAGAPSGICIYEGELLKTLRGKIILADPGPRVVRALSMKSVGAGFAAESTDILSSNESWFRPSDVCVAPDGSLFVADWNDAGVGGHNMADHNLTKMTGRIYRIAPKGSKFSMPKLDLVTTAGNVAALKSPTVATRSLVWTKLHEMQDKAEKQLVKVWKSDDLRMRARALQLLARINGKDKKYLGEAIRDKAPEIRCEALRIAREIKFDVIPLVTQLVRDPSAQVRRECAIALHHNFKPEAPSLWTQLALQHDGKDRWYLEALGIAADDQWETFFKVWLEAVGENWNTPIGRDIIWRSRSSKTPSLLVKLISDKAISEEDRKRFLRAVDFQNGPEKDAALIELLGVN